MKLKKLQNGIRVIEGDTHIGKWVEETGKLDHDQHLVPLICNLIKDGDTVIDVGAYIGDHTMAYIRSVGLTGQVIAFEPNPYAFQCLQMNCGQTGGGQHRFYSFAVGDKQGAIELDIDPLNYGASTIRKEIDEEHDYSTPLMTLDTVCRYKKVRLIKIDAEGYELKVLKGAKELIEINKPIIVMESCAGHLKRNGTSQVELYNWIKAKGYSIETLTGNSIYDEQCDVLCRPI